MMIEQHYDEEVLAGFLAEPVDSAARDKHLAGCSLCKQTLDSIRGTAGLLKQPDVWARQSFSSAPRAETLAFLRNVQKTMSDEDAAAEHYVKQLLAGSRDTWAPRLENHPEWRTAGVVRKLIAAAVKATDVMPADAVEISGMLVDISNNLRAENYPPTVVERLRFTSLFERAHALMYTGAHIEALAALAAADALAPTIGSELERARLDLVRILVYQTLERRDEALVVARSAARVFQEYDDFSRYASARSSEAIVLYHARRFREAVAIQVALADNERLDPRWRAAALHNAALCYRELGDFDSSIKYTVKAIDALDRQQMVSIRVKSRWNLARVFAAQQRHVEAVQIFSSIQEEFSELGMAIDVALVAVDTAESLLALNRIAEIPAACKVAMDYFRAANLGYTEGALKALATLREAADRSTLTAADFRDFRAYLERLPRDPKMLFASPPN
jgi:tetratricopeptide (TPR) repeat protein